MCIVRYCEVLGAAGYHTYVKDHPLQFGFRQRELFERLSKLPFVTLVPYDVPANLLIGKCAISVTFTGTIGFQAALAGLCSVVTEPYYATEQHYLHVRSFGEIENLGRAAGALAATREPASGAPGYGQTFGGRQCPRGLFHLAEFRCRKAGNACQR